MFEKSEGWVVTEKGYIHYKILEQLASCMGVVYILN